jgi:hypothetical protein
MTQLGQPQGTWVSLETLILASWYLDQLWNTWVSLKVFGLAMDHLGQPQGLRSAMKHLGQFQGTWISLGTLVSASRILDRLWNT